jgi:hypothetical protein
MLVSPLLLHFLTSLRELKQTPNNFFWFLIWLFFTIAIGGRYEIGSDWSNYLAWYEFARDHTFIESVVVSDFGYMAINWVCARMDLGIQGVNTICGAIFTYGLVRFCNRQPLPWLSFYIAIPYLTIIVVMGYSRQGVAIGIILLALTKLTDGQLLKFFCLLILATLFHQSAILIGFLLFTNNSYSTKIRILFLVLFLIFCVVALLGSVGYLMNNYIENKMESEGALIRALLNCLPVLAALPFFKRLSSIGLDFTVLKWMSVLSIISLSLLLIPQLNISSTFIDRITLYLMPLQLIIWPRLVYLMPSNVSRWMLINFILLMYASILIAWMLFSPNSASWYPYKFSLEAV